MDTAPSNSPMTRCGQIAHSLVTQPGYTLTRGVARFPAVRGTRRVLNSRRLRAHLADLNDFEAAQRALGKPFLLAQYFNITDGSAAVRLPSEGRHVCVVASHRRPPLLRPSDQWTLRCYSDAEVTRTCASERFLESCGPAGTAFAENTLCVHRALPPTRRPRLLLQLQHALFDDGGTHDRRSLQRSRMVA